MGEIYKINKFVVWIGFVSFVCCVGVKVWVYGLSYSLRLMEFVDSEFNNKFFWKEIDVKSKFIRV